jgi:hypothetical protein
MTEYGMRESVVAVGLRRVTVATTVEVDKVVGEICGMFDDTVVLAAAVGVDAEVHVLHGHMIP